MQMQTINIGINYGSSRTTFHAISDNPPQGKSTYKDGGVGDDWRRHEGFVTEWAVKNAISYFQISDADIVYVTTTGNYDKTGFEPAYMSAGKWYYNGELVRSPTPPPPPPDNPPAPPPPPGCTEGKTRKVNCPKNGREVTQMCVGGEWINKGPCDETEDGRPYDPVMAVLMAAVIGMAFLFLLSGRK